MGGKKSKHRKKSEPRSKIQFSGPVEFFVGFAVATTLAVLLTSMFREQIFDLFISFTGL